MNILNTLLGSSSKPAQQQDQDNNMSSTEASNTVAPAADVTPAANAVDTTSAPAPVDADAELKPHEALKVFAGNLAFSTSDADLTTIFSSAGTVTAAQVVTRGTRSLGYGFVTFSNASEAAKAVETLNGQDVGGRKINVEAVKPESQGGGAKGKPAGTAGTDGTTTEGGAAAAAQSRTNRQPRAGASRRPRKDEGEEETSAAEGGATGARKSNSTNARTRKPRTKATNGALGTPAAGEALDVNGHSSNTGVVDGTPAAGTTKERKPTSSSTAPRKPSGPKGAPEGPPSQTLLFVANLPFEINKDELLRGVFEGYKVVSAKVATVPFRKRSKGYGFVDFETHEEQQRALKECQGKSVEGREISIKVAIEDEKRKAKIDVDGTPAADATADAPTEVTKDETATAA